MSTFTIGVDLGTTGTKVVVLEAGRGVVSVAARHAMLSSPHAGWAEADPDEWWANVCALIPEVLAAAGLTAADIAAVACSGMVPAVVVTDGDNRPLRPAILQNDARAGAEIAELAKALDHVDLVTRSGSALTQQSVAPTLVWLARHEPGTWSATRRVVGSYDWLAAALGAGGHVEGNWALESGLYDLGGALIPEVLEAACVDPGVLVPVRRPGTPAGTVGAAAAAATSLAAGTPIVVGGADHVLSAYAAGLAEPGDWLVKLGGAGDILAVTDHPFVDRRLYLDEHPVAGRWLPNGCMATSGSLIRWWAGVTSADMAALEAEAAVAGPAEILCLPYLLGEKSPLHDPDLRGCFFGMHLGHGRGDLHRSALEGIAYGFRHHTEVFAERGVTLGEARVSNGGSRSRVWKQILADALGHPLVPVADHPGASLGAAMAAAVGVGGMDWADGPAMVRTDDAVLPDPLLAERYDEAYRCWRELAELTTPLAHRLAGRDRPCAPAGGGGA